MGLVSENAKTYPLDVDPDRSKRENLILELPTLDGFRTTVLNEYLSPALIAM
jgi:hypothetical protein